MSPSASNPALTQSGDYPNFFRTIASDDVLAKFQVDFVLNVLRRKKIALLHDDGDYGKSLAGFVKSFLEKDKRAQIVMYDGITMDASDYSEVANKIKRSKAEAVIFGGYHPEAYKIVTQMRKDKMHTIFIFNAGVKDDNFIKVAGKYAEGVYSSGLIDTTKNLMAMEAIEAHKKKYGSNPGIYFLNAYSAALALLNAIEKSKSTNYDDIVRSLRNEFVETPLGKLRFDERGDAIGSDFSMYQVQNGVYVEIKLKKT
jgi:branched-chain amino acid transport system substrate-binding protein